MAPMLADGLWTYCCLLCPASMCRGQAVYHLPIKNKTKVRIYVCKYYLYILCDMLKLSMLDMLCNIISFSCYSPNVWDFSLVLILVKSYFLIICQAWHC